MASGWFAKGSGQRAAGSGQRAAQRAEAGKTAFGSRWVEPLSSGAVGLFLWQGGARVERRRKADQDRDVGPHSWWLVAATR